jgi:hypothetical protein
MLPIGSQLLSNRKIVKFATFLNVLFLGHFAFQVQAVEINDLEINDDDLSSWHLNELATPDDLPSPEAMGILNSNDVKQQFTLKSNEVKNQYQVIRETLLTQSREATQKDLQELKNYRIIFVPGIWANLYPKIVKYARLLGLGLPKDALVSFANQLEYAKNNGLDYEYAPINTSFGCIDNGHVMAETIRRSPKKVILVSHSKGGIDILHALKFDPSLKDKIQGWVAFQAPFYGTPITQFIQKLPIARILGDSNSISCLTPDYRMKFLKESNGSIAQILKELNVITVSTSADEAGKNYFDIATKAMGSFSFFSTTKRWLQNYPFYLDNDGLVPVNSACFASISGRCLFFNSLDHAAPVMDVYPFHSLGKNERILMTRTLLKMISKE